MSLFNICFEPLTALFDIFSKPLTFVVTKVTSYANSTHFDRCEKVACLFYIIYNNWENKSMTCIDSFPFFWFLLLYMLYSIFHNSQKNQITSLNNYPIFNKCQWCKTNVKKWHVPYTIDVCCYFPYYVIFS